MKLRLLAACCFLVLLFFPTPAAAVSEAKPCAADPTDQAVAYGDVLSGPNCLASPAGDVDIFRFTGSEDDVIRLAANDLSGSIQIAVCLELFDPNNQPVVPQACGDVSVELNPPKLTLTGTYTVFISEAGNNSVLGYNWTLERLTPPRTDWPPIDFGQTVSDEINPTPDLDAYRLNGTAGDIIRIVGVDLSGSIQIGVCVELLRPDSTPVFSRTCGDVSVQLDVTLTTTGVHTLLVSENGLNSPFGYNVSLNCLSGVCAPKLPVCEVGLGMSGNTLNIDFTLRTATPATWNLWISAMSTTARLWSVGPLTVDPRVSIPLTAPGFPALGTIGFLSTLTTPSGIICSDFETVNTGPLTSGAAPLTLDQLRSLIRPREP